jgi:hypothetical protein
MHPGHRTAAEREPPDPNKTSVISMSHSSEARFLVGPGDDCREHHAAKAFDPAQADQLAAKGISALRFRAQTLKKLLAG